MKLFTKKLAAILMSLVMVTAALTGCGSGNGDTKADTKAADQAQDGSTAANDKNNADGNDAATDATVQEPAAGTNAEDGGAGAADLDGSWPEEKIKIGVEVYDTTDLTVIAYQDYFNYLAEYYNLEFMFSESISSAEAELNFVDSCASAGCKGYIGGYNYSMNEVVDAVTGHGMYYWGAERGLDAEYADNEYYLGGFKPVSSDGTESDKNGDYLTGYEMAYTLAEQGCKHVVFCNGGASFGVQMFVDRQTGFMDGIKAAQADGLDIVFDESKDIIEGWPGTDEFAAAQTSALDSDYDGVAVAFSGLQIWIQPIATAGKSDSIKLAGVGAVSDSLLDVAKSGQLSCLIYECEEVVFGNAVTMVVNAITGNASVSKNGTQAGVIPVARWNITDGETYEKIYEKHAAGEYYISAQDLAQCFPQFNPDATYESICDFYKSFTLENTVK